jgi:hypothetical protein
MGYRNESLLRFEGNKPSGKKIEGKKIRAKTAKGISASERTAFEALPFGVTATSRMKRSFRDSASKRRACEFIQWAEIVPPESRRGKSEALLLRVRQ